jgi:hypothetical protein
MIILCYHYLKTGRMTVSGHSADDHYFFYLQIILPVLSGMSIQGHVADCFQQFILL